MSERNDFNQQVIQEFRANQGKVGGRLANMPLLLLTTTGAKSGRAITKPLVYTREGERIVIIASFAGGPKNPPWYHNLVANPRRQSSSAANAFGCGPRQPLGKNASGCSTAKRNRCPFLPSISTRPPGRYRCSCSRALTEDSARYDCHFTHRFAVNVLHKAQRKRNNKGAVPRCLEHRCVQDARRGGTRGHLGPSRGACRARRGTRWRGRA